VRPRRFLRHNGGEVGGAQAEALRIPHADGTLYPLAVGENDAPMPSLLTLSDVMGTGHHAAVTARVRRGGAVGRVGVPHYDVLPGAQSMFHRNVVAAGGPAPVHAYIDELLTDVMEGRIEPGRVFDRTVGFDGVPDGYRIMNECEALKVLIRP
jgi:threonine dehydrogenase-like Zn-dependent dehydrogenase